MRQEYYTLLFILLFFIIWLEAKKYMLREEFEDFNFSDTWNGLYSVSTIAYWVLILAIFGPITYMAFIPAL
jgi:hypothetical protein